MERKTMEKKETDERGIEGKGMEEWGGVGKQRKRRERK